MNPFTGQPFFFLSDPPHLIKKLRGAAMGGARGARILHTQAGPVSWEHIKELVADDSNSQYLGVTHKLTQRHIAPNNWEKMKVSLAVQVLSRSVADALSRKILDQGRVELTGTRDYVFECNHLFDQLNHGSLIGSEDMQSTGSPEDRTKASWAEKLEQSSEWFNHQAALQQEKQHLTASDRERTWLAAQTQFDVTLGIRGMLGFAAAFLARYPDAKLLPCRFNQDALENLFGQIRQGGRGNTNPSENQYGYHLQAKVMSASHNPVKKGNTTSQAQIHAAKISAPLLKPWQPSKGSAIRK